MRNPLREKIPVSDCSEDSDDSDDYNVESVTNRDQSRDSAGDSDSESDHEKEGNPGKSASEDESESESDSESDSDDKDEEFDHKWEELRNEAPDTDEITRRIAVCNMDWDRIRAVDLLVCFNSFKPADGIINSVKIYPSEFGLQRMEEEKLKGPPELVEETLPLDKEEVDDKKTSKYHREKLRQYQINRLKYYYAVVDCDVPETANAIYEQLNGMEYESSSVRFDLRFIPDDMTFDHKPTCVAEKVPADYKPRLFVTSALQQVKVDLTWDETDPKRRDFFQKVFTDLDSVQDDIKDYLASASSESEDEIDTIEEEPEQEDGNNIKTKDRIAKYKELLKSIEEKEKKENEEKIDVEVTWEPALKKKTEEKVKEKIKKSSLNPFEEMILKKKEQKKLKKKDLKTQTQSEDSEEDSEEETSETSLNEKSKKNKKLAELALISDYKDEVESASTSSCKKKKKNKDKSDDLDGFVADMNDPRFSAMYTSSLFNIVPTEHQKKNDRNFTLKRPKQKNFKSHGFQKHNKKARYH